MHSSQQQPSPNGPSPVRKVIFFIGVGMLLVGACLFISTFFTAAANFGNFDNFHSRVRSQSLRAVSGMVLMTVGGFTAIIGGATTAGTSLAGSRSPGDLINKVMADSEANNRGTAQGPPAPVVMVRCQYCKSLNSETDKVCAQCGGKLY